MSVSETAREVAEYTADHVHAALASASTPLPIIPLMDEAAAACESRSDTSRDRDRRECAPGCSACCRMPVSMTPAEGLWIAAKLRETRSAAELESLIEGLGQRAAVVGPMTIEARAAARVPCLLLDERGACSIHTFRPLGCRGWTSFSRADCEAALEANQAGHSGPLDRMALAVASATTEGLEYALRQVKVDAGQHELHNVLHRALTADRALERWSDGEPIFADLPRVQSERLKAGWGVAPGTRDAAKRSASTSTPDEDRA